MNTIKLTQFEEEYMNQFLPDKVKWLIDKS